MILPSRLFQTRLSRFVTATALLTGLWLGSQPPPAQAGCGCTKAPPAPAAVRPHATFVGTDVTLFHPDLVSGQQYNVTFTSGVTGETASVNSEAVFQRDLADAAYKTQLVVSLPDLPLGPVSIRVSLGNLPGLIMAADDSALTVVPQPIKIDQKGKTKHRDYRAAISRDGVFYISLDVASATEPRVIQAQAKDYPFRFSHEDAVFYNTQGFIMQLLGENMPGLYAVEEPDRETHSDILQYSRHEFNSYVLQHAERQAHAVDANDPNWHLDGTPHIDHDNMILAIAGVLDDGTLPVPGETPEFELVVTTHTLFADGLAGDAYVEMKDHASTDSYKADHWEGHGNVLTNGTLIMRGDTEVKGDAMAFGFDLADNAAVTEAAVYADEPKEFLVVDMPHHLEELGALVISGHDSLVVRTGSYHVSEVSVSGHGELYIDNTDGPVTLYISGPVAITGHALVTLADLDPEKFAIYVMSSDDVTLSQLGEFYGVLYAPDSLVKIAGHGEFYGAFVGAEVVLSEHAEVHYDKSLFKGDKKPSDKEHERSNRDAERQNLSGKAKKAAGEAEKAVEEALEIVAETQAKAGEIISDMAAKATKTATDMAGPIEDLAEKAVDVAEEMASKVAKVVEEADKAAAEADEAATATKLKDAEKAADKAQKAADKAADKATDAEEAAAEAANDMSDEAAKVDAEVVDVADEVTTRVSDAQADVAELTAKALEKVAKAQEQAAEAVVYAGKAKKDEGFAAAELANAAVVTTQQAYDDVETLGAQAIADAQTVADQIIADAQAHADQANVAAAAATAQAAASATQAADIASQAAASAAQAAATVANF